MNKRKSISLPTEILLLIFKDMCSPLRLRPSWQEDIVNCALVCREWTCALSLLLVDFRSEDLQRYYPPEIVKFTNALIVRPSLALEIKHLSVSYFKHHYDWEPPSRSAALLVPTTVSKLRADDIRRLKFSNAFLSILRLAVNVHILSLDAAIAFAESPNDLADALSGHTALDKLRLRCDWLTMPQLLSCIATCASLNRLTILGIRSPDTPTFLPVEPTTPPSSLSCRLSVLALRDVPIDDDELACLVNASRMTLQRLTLYRVERLTNVGLRAALTTVSGSLTYLCAATDVFPRTAGEEHALDTTIAQMVRLVKLEIDPDVASVRMLERRAEAFAHGTTGVPEVHLRLVVRRSAARKGPLFGAVEGVWPGWIMGKVLRT